MINIIFMKFDYFLYIVAAAPAVSFLIKSKEDLHQPAPLLQSAFGEDPSDDKQEALTDVQSTGLATVVEMAAAAAIAIPPPPPPANITNRRHYPQHHLTTSQSHSVLSSTLPGGGTALLKDKITSKFESNRETKYGKLYCYI